MPESFAIAMKLAGETDPSRCVMIDDLTRTTRAAKSAGMFSILFGETAANGDANASLSDWNELIKYFGGAIMEENKAVIGALLFIVLVVGANFVMYAIARGAANSKQKGFWETHRQIPEHIHEEG